MEKSRLFNREKLNRFIAATLSFLFIMQQSLCYQVIASTITNADGSAINKNPQTGNFEIRPDAFNGDVGFKQFGKIDLSKGDVMNFIYQWYQQNQTVNGDTVTHTYKTGDINTFINLVNEGVNINGIVNALTKIGSNGALKTDGNLMFISPNGMVVGSSGVLNVGNLSVITPTPTSYKTLSDSLALPQSSNYAVKEATAHNGVIDPDSIVYDKNTLVGVATDKTFNAGLLEAGTGAISINGKVLARGNVELNGGTVAVGNGGLLLAGVGNDTTVFKTEDAATTLFDTLVNTDNMNTGSGFANSNGNIVITSSVGTSVGANAKVRNYAANSNITINNSGADGVSISGEVSNPNGTLAINNKGGELLVNTTGTLLNKGAMNLVNNGTGINLNGTVTNTGNLTINNETGANGLLVGGGVVTNKSGTANITNSKGLLKVAQGAKVVSEGTSLTVTNTATGSGTTIAGTVENKAGTATVENRAGELLVDTTGLIKGSGSKLTIKNSGSGLRIAAGGAVQNTNTLEISNSGANGLNVLGSITNNGTATVTNTSGLLNVGGTVTNTGDLTMTNDGSGFTIGGTVTNNTGAAKLTNNKGLLNVANGGSVVSNGTSLNMTNSATGTGMTIAGTVNNTAGTATIDNKAGNLLVDTTGRVIGKGSQLTMKNTGSQLRIAKGGSVTNTNQLTISNSGANGLNVLGSITNTGKTDISNTGAAGINP